MAQTEQSKVLLAFSPSLSPGFRTASKKTDSGKSKSKEALFSSLATSTTSPEAILAALDSVDSSSSSLQSVSGSRTPQSDELSNAVLLKSAVSALGLTIDRLLSEALQAEEELDWWRSVESSRWNTAYYLLQTSPLRVARLAHDIAIIARTHDVPFTFQSLNRETFKARIAPHLQAFNSLFPAVSSRRQSFTARYAPTELARQECEAHRKELESVRDKRAEQLGMLTFLSTGVQSALKELEGGVSTSSSSSTEDKYAMLAQMITSAMDAILSEGSLENIPSAPATSPSASIRTYITSSFPAHTSSHARSITPHIRPSYLIRAWPRLVILPPLLLYGISSAFTNRATIYATMNDAGETIRGFWIQWVLEPVKSILDTVRTGGDDSASRVVSKDGLKSDMDSLERMVISLATEKRNWSEADIQQLSEQVRQGDLTPVLKVYEGDIKSPIKSAISGTLIRSLLIQVQKAKVDIDLALAGIDKLLKSQELTFGFVGVAPSLAVLYVASGWISYFFFGSGSRKQYGGKKGRKASFYAMRRVERLLTQAAPPSSSPNPAESILKSFTTSLSSSSAHQLLAPNISPQTQGHLMIALTSLRTFGSQHLPARSAQKAGFMDDLADLEDPSLGREDKLRVVQRMWRSWGGIVGWGAKGNV